MEEEQRLFFRLVSIGWRVSSVQKLENELRVEGLMAGMEVVITAEWNSIDVQTER